LPAHRDLIAAMARSLTGAPLPSGLTAASPEEVAQRFAVHRNTVAVSLAEALAQRFPVICRLVGAAFFAAMARVYAERHRPQSPVLLEWGGSFPGFLAAFPPLAAYPYMADVARIEWARGLAFHAADARPAEARIFAGADPAVLRLRLHPAVHVLRCAHPAVSIWRMNQPDAPPGLQPPAGSEIALILRDRHFAVPVQPISAADAAMIDLIRSGSTLMTAALHAQSGAPGHDPQPLILHLMQAGAILDPKEDMTCDPCSVG
jgi:hypothetical protein